jgi:hypothetical protein
VGVSVAKYCVIKFSQNLSGYMIMLLLFLHNPHNSDLMFGRNQEVFDVLGGKT